MNNSFLLIKRSSVGALLIDGRNDLTLRYQTLDWILYINPYEKVREICVGDKKTFIIGDCVSKNATGLSNSINELKGNFYVIVFYQNTILLRCSFLGILPIYYLTNQGAISSSFELLKELFKDDLTIEKSFLLECLLFNYGFTDRTIYKQIKILGSNSILEINNKNMFKITRGNDLINLFTARTNSSGKTRNYLSDFFIENVKEYFPEEKFSVTFTGGFDGRTIVAATLANNHKFHTCSFGTGGSNDVEIPLKNVRELGLIHNIYMLNDPDYLSVHYGKYSRDINIKNPGFNGYIYPHFKFLAEKESENSRYLLTGFFGSELFRALHLTGAVTSDTIIMLFSLNNDVKLKKYIVNSYRLKFVNMDYFKEDLENLIDEIISYKKELPSGLTKNQKFYVFVFEETFRKLFGSIINVQNDHLFVRTPYLDYSFIVELLKTDLAGANNDFITSNPLKRFKGQLFYAEVLKKTCPTIFKQKTGKGYRPSALIEPFGFAEIILPYFIKKLSGIVKRQHIDNLGIISGLERNYKYFTEILKKDLPLINASFLLDQMKKPEMLFNESIRDLVSHVLSIAEVL